MKGKNLFILKRTVWETGPDRMPLGELNAAGAESPPEGNSSGASIGADEGGYFEAFHGKSAACF
jgi:hypothetical protein